MLSKKPIYALQSSKSSFQIPDFKFKLDFLNSIPNEFVNINDQNNINNEEDAPRIKSNNISNPNYVKNLKEGIKSLEALGEDGLTLEQEELQENGTYTINDLYFEDDSYDDTNIAMLASSPGPLAIDSATNVFSLVNDEPDNEGRQKSLISNKSILHSKLRRNMAKKKGDYMCGLGSFYPKCLQRFANIKLFSIHYALAILSILMFHTNFIGSVTSIEKRFGFPSKKSGFLMSINDIGHVPFVILASFYLGNSRKPLILGIGTILFSIGVFLVTLPYFIYGPGDDYKKISFADDKTFSYSSSSNNSESLFFNQTLIFNHEVLSLMRNNSKEDTHVSNYICQKGHKRGGKIGKVCNKADFNQFSYVVMSVGEVILGIGGSWIGPLGVAYIDDNVKDSKSVPLYMVTRVKLATVSCVRSLGPVFGFLLSALCAGLHETLKDPGLDKRDPRWIGAWWLGFCLIICLQIVIGIPLVFYPKHMKSQGINSLDRKEKLESLNGNKIIVYTHLSKKSDGDTLLVKVRETKKFTSILKAVNDLLKNPVYMITTIGECISIYSIVGYMIFLPKFMESQFAISASQANIIAGALGVFSSSTGILIGGYIMKKLNIKLRGALLISIIGLLITSIKAIILMNLRCEPIRLSGYISEETSCNLQYFEPVCGNNDNRLYYNPCFAGCESYIRDKQIKAYTNCSCLEKQINNLNGSLSNPSSATPGLCKRGCRQFIPYLIIMAFGSFLAAPSIVAVTMVKLRCVTKEEKPFALGFSSFLMSLIAFLPGPLITGALIDKTCLVWKHSSCYRQGSCLFYDTDKLRFVIHGILTLSKLVATFCYLIAWRFSKDKRYHELENTHY
ncbi:solute carrier organic anion transporter family member 2A1-like [Gordionus sp. m RMFG-2023]|uniref:solute carrier organic anion transporter family member 2A1-like n=1 Tax=Gordionus sp. m RMFG-2023 TaxID=3053472 RepID=UPI0031FD542E